MNSKTSFVFLAALSAVSAYSQYSLTPGWSLKPGDRAYLNTDSTQRGLAYNAATDEVLLVSRTGSTAVYRLSGVDGSDLGTLNVTGITGGTFSLNMISTGTDGAIYGINLTTDSSTTPLKIYRWADANSAPVLAYSGDPSNADAAATNRRFGDNFDVRGSGAGTEIVVASRSGTIISVLNTAEGLTLKTKKIATDAVAADLGLGVAFGSGNTIWATASGRPIRELNYNVSGGTATTIANFGATQIPLAVAPISYDVSRSLLAGVQLNTTPTADTFVLYDVSTGTPALLDSKSFPVDNANINGTGAVDFGNGKVFALDSNNGILTYSVVPEPGTIALGIAGAAALILAARKKVSRL
jgi:hypothetical protein